MAAPPRIRGPRTSRSKHERVPLGLGDFAWPGSGLGAQVAARDHFMDALNEVCPDVIFTLHQQCLRACRAFLSARGDNVSLEDWHEIAADRDYDLTGAALNLRELVLKWGDRWNLTDEWVREIALASLEAWTHGGRVYMWFPRGESGGTAGHQALELRGWDPGGERWSEWERRLRETLPKTLEWYREVHVARVLKAGMVPTGTRLRSHFLWLARYQVIGESMGAVARWARSDVSSVRRAVRSLAALMELTVRAPTRGGRPSRRKPAAN